MSENNIDDIFNATAGKVLKKYRLNKKMSLEELAQKMKTNISRQSLFKYENGKARLKTETFMDICNALNLDPKRIFNEIHEQSSLIANKVYSNDPFAKSMTEFLVSLEYNNFRRNNNLDNNENIVFDELELLFDKHKDILTDDDKEYIKFIIEKRRKEINKELREE